MSATHAGVIYRAGSKILLVRRAAHENNAGEWEFPAGSIDGDELPHAAALREFFEETGGVPDTLHEKPREYGSFLLFSGNGAQFNPILSDEHDGYIWANPGSFPIPLRAPCADQLATCAMDSADDIAEDAASARKIDQNGFVTIERNTITKAGVFHYPGGKLPGGDPSKVYAVYRPREEVTNPDTLASFKLLPFINEHEMLGEGYERGAEDRGVHGSTGEDVLVEGDEVKVPIRIFSRSLTKLIDSGKKGLSLGYRCNFEKSAGEINGIRYDYIQKDIRGNHLALVNEGRCGTAVLDEKDFNFAMDHFDLALETGDFMVVKAEEKKTTDAQDGVEMTPLEMSQAIRKLTHAMDEFVKEKDKAEDADEDEKKKAEDEDESEKDKKKAEDEAGNSGEDEDDKDKAKEKDAMDQLDTKLGALAKRIPTVKDLRAEIKNADALAGKIAAHVGTFDHSAMDEAEVVKYGCEKFGLKNSRDALEGYLAAAKKPAATAAFAMDSVAKPKADGLLTKRLNGAQA